MKKINLLAFAACFCILFTSCFKDQDDERGLASNLEIQDFIWSGLNIFYLYKSDQPNLADDRFANQESLHDFLNNYATPEELFYDLIVDQDRFSFIVPDYTVLENSLNGTTTNNGMEYGLVQVQSTGEVFGYVRYVLPNSSAAEQGISRGMVFDRIDGIEITASNYAELLSPTTYTIGLADFDGENLTSLDQSYTLTKEQYTENPVYISTTLNVENEKIGYLMYNGFTRNFDEDLNAAFASFQGEGITDLIIDLRYNSGGSVETSNDLASMITGQFNGELFSTQVYNENFEDDERYFNNEISTGSSINSLNLNRVYVITTGSTASASELLISSLMPYIEVIQVGTTTVGKFQGSVTLYDSPDFSRENVNISHQYAMQPLILKSVNANGFTDYINGLEPDIEIAEDFTNLGTLGDPEEPMLNAAINAILGLGRPAGKSSSLQQLELIGESDMFDPTYQRMYIEDVQ